MPHGKESRIVTFGGLLAPLLLIVPARDRKICKFLAREIDRNLPEAENKIWHAHPVWFLDGNPIVGYSKIKNCVRPLFWSDQPPGAPGPCVGGLL